MTDLLVLCYHAVSPTWPAALSVTEPALEEQMAELARRGYRGGTFTDAVAAPEHGRTVVVTFDDSYRSVLERAKPILDRWGFPGTLFVPTDWIGSRDPMQWPGIDRWLGTQWEPDLHSLTWDELRGLADGGWEIGSHTCSHPRLTSLGDAELVRQLADSKAALESGLQRACSSLAFPYGDVDGRVEAATSASGYECAGSIPRVLYPPRAMSWPRTPIFHRDSLKRFRSKVSPRLRQARATRAGAALDSLRIRLPH